MDLQQAIQKHAEWLVKFRAAIKKQEHVDAASIRKDDACEIGKWLKGPGRNTHGGLASYKDCVGKHQTFHLQAGKVAEVINAGDYAKAEKMLS